MLSNKKFQIKEIHVSQTFSSECNEIFPGMASRLLGDNPWNIGKNILQVRPTTLSRRRKRKQNKNYWQLLSLLRYTQTQ